MTYTIRIGEVTRRLDLNPKTIRYYEEIGLLPEPERTEGGFRTYTLDEVEWIDFIRRARALDLSLDEVRETLSFRDRGDASVLSYTAVSKPFNQRSSKWKINSIC